MNVYSSVYITVMRDFAVMTTPIVHTQIKEHLDLSAGMANFTCGCPSVNLHNVLASFLCLPFDFQSEICKAVVRNFASPEALHAVKVQVFEETDIKLSDKFKCEFDDCVYVFVPCICRFALQYHFQMVRWHSQARGEIHRCNAGDSIPQTQGKINKKMETLAVSTSQS